MSYEIKSIKTDYGNNFGGGKLIRLFPKEWLIGNADFVAEGMLDPQFIYNIDNGIGSVDQVKSIRFLENSLIYNEKPKTSTSGNFFEVSISGIILKDDPVRMWLVNNLRYFEFIVLFSSFNYEKGMYKVIGNTQYGMRIDSEFDSGKQPKDATQYQLSFSLSCIDIPPYVQLDESIFPD